MSWLSRVMGGGRPAGAATDQTDGKAGGDDGPVKQAQVRIDSVTYEVAEIGIRHFRVKDYTGGLIVRQCFDCTLVVDLGDEPMDVPIYGTVLKIDPEEGLVSYFGSLPPYYQRVLIQYLRRWRKHNPAAIPAKRPAKRA